jgi:hypothetical protein
VQLGFHQTRILQCTIMAQCKFYNVKILSKEDARCLPCSREEEKLPSLKLGVLSNTMGSVPMRYDALSYVRHKVRMVRATLLKSLKVINNLSYSFPSITPISYLYLRT